MGIPAGPGGKAIPHFGDLRPGREHDRSLSTAPSPSNGFARRFQAEISIEKPYGQLSPNLRRNRFLDEISQRWGTTLRVWKTATAIGQRRKIQYCRAINRHPDISAACTKNFTRGRLRQSFFEIHTISEYNAPRSATLSLHQIHGGSLPCSTAELAGATV